MMKVDKFKNRLFFQKQFDIAHNVEIKINVDSKGWGFHYNKRGYYIKK